MYEVKVLGAERALKATDDLHNARCNAALRTLAVRKLGRGCMQEHAG